MAPLPAVPGVLKHSFTITDSADIAAGSRFFLSYTGGPPNSTDMNTLAEDSMTAFSSTMVSSLQNSEHLTEIVCTDLSSDSGAQGEWSGSVAGGAAGDQLQSGMCACVNHQISRRYRGGKPKTFVRTGTASDLNGTNQWSTDFLTTIREAWEAWIAAILATTGLSITLSNIVNVSYFQGFTAFEEPTGRYRNIPKLRATPVVDDIVLSTVATKLGSQRRRLNL